MAELTQKELLQPSLLDRLTDDEPEKKTAESRDKRIFSFRRLKQSVMRDLEWLLNTGSMETSVDLDTHSEVKSSVLNYGIPDFSGTTASSTDSSELEHLLRQAIVNFEPRILSDSLRIRAINRADHGVSDQFLQPNTLAFEIECELWAEPVPERLFLRTVLDLELGDFEIKER